MMTTDNIMCVVFGMALACAVLILTSCSHDYYADYKNCIGANQSEESCQSYVDMLRGKE